MVSLLVKIDDVGFTANEATKSKHNRQHCLPPYSVLFCLTFVQQTHEDAWMNSMQVLVESFGLRLDRSIYFLSSTMMGCVGIAPVSCAQETS